MDSNPDLDFKGKVVPGFDLDLDLSSPIGLFWI